MDWDKAGKRIILSLYDKGMIKTWYSHNPEGWKLISGLWSPFYINLRPLVSYPQLLWDIGRVMGDFITEKVGKIDRVIGIAMNGIPISVAISLSKKIPSCYTRKLANVKNETELKNYLQKYGEHSMVEGELKENDYLTLVDDLVTRFDSKLIAIQQINVEKKIRGLKNLEFSNVAVVFDREQGAQKQAEKNGYVLHSLIPFRSKGIEWLKPKFHEIEYEVIKKYLYDFNEFQSKERIKELVKIAS